MSPLLDDLPFQLAARLQHHEYRIIQEQLNNIVKYAAAKQAPELHHIIDRVTKLQGAYSLHKAHGNGCSWVIDIPLQTITEQQLIVSH